MNGLGASFLIYGYNTVRYFVVVFYKYLHLFGHFSDFLCLGSLLYSISSRSVLVSFYSALATKTISFLKKSYLENTMKIYC